MRIKQGWELCDVMESGSQIEAGREPQENDHKKHHVRREKEASARPTDATGWSYQKLRGSARHRVLTSRELHLKQ